MSESPEIDLRAWLEEAVDLYMQRGEVPDAYPAGVVDVRWEHNSPLALPTSADALARERPQPRPGFTFTAELESGETIEVWRP